MTKEKRKKAITIEKKQPQIVQVDPTAGEEDCESSRVNVIVDPV